MLHTAVFCLFQVFHVSHVRPLGSFVRPHDSYVLSLRCRHGTEGAPQRVQTRPR